jgi:hypothetical protein
MKKKKKEGLAVTVVIAATSTRGFITEALPPQVWHFFRRHPAKFL